MRGLQEPPIRTLLAILFALLVAAGLLVAGYSALWSLQRAPLASEDVPPLPAPPTALPAPTRLAPRVDHVAAVPASARRPLVVAATLQVRVAGVPSAFRERLGVATFGRFGGGNFQWTPLTTATADGADLLLEAAVPVGTEIQVTLAASREQARHDYLAKTSVAALDGQSTARTLLRADFREVAFELPESPAATISRGPWRLSRTDDPQWLPLQLASTGLFLQGDAATRLLLGAGAYRLEDPLEPERNLEFVVPDVDRVVLTATLAEPRAAHR